MEEKKTMTIVAEDGSTEEVEVLKIIKKNM